MKRLVRSHRGATTVEFALISMPLLMMIMGGIEFGVQMFARARLEGVLRQAARMATTGDADNGDDGENIDAYVRKSLQVYGKTDVDIQKLHYQSFDQVRQPEKVTSGAPPKAPYCWTDINGNQNWDQDPGSTGLGGADDIIDYKVKVTYDALFPFVTKAVTQTSRLSVSSEATLRNEPFAGDTGATTKTCCVSTTGSGAKCS